MIINPYTKRKIKFNGKTHQELMKYGLLDTKGKEINKCKWDVTNKIIGSGIHGNIYMTCCNDDENCNYVTKVQQRIYRWDLKTQNKWFTREINFQNELAELGLTLPVIDHWIREKYYFVMERLNETADEHIKSFNSIEVKSTIVGKLTNLIDSLHQNGYFHNDLNLTNIMVRYDENKFKNIKNKYPKNEYKQYINTGYEYFFIDTQSMYTSDDFIEFEIKNKKEAREIDYGMFIGSLEYSLNMKELLPVIYFLTSTKLTL